MDLSDGKEEQEDSDSVDDANWITDVTPIPQFIFDDASSGVKIDVNNDSSPRDIFDKAF